MFFGKKEQAKPANKILERNNPVSFPDMKEEDIHVMPGKYVVIRPSASKKTGKNMAVILVILVLFLIVLLGGAAWYIINSSKPKPAVNKNQNNTGNTTANANVDTKPVEQNNVNINSNINSNINVNQNSNNNTNTVVSKPEDNLDTDSDGLTLTEEAMYGTNPALADTDKDGYKDGQELINLYNPLVANQPLLDSALVKKYSNESFGYELLVPKNFTLSLSLSQCIQTRI